MLRVSQTEFGRTVLNFFHVRHVADVRHKFMKSQWALGVRCPFKVN